MTEEKISKLSINLTTVKDQLIHLWLLKDSLTFLLHQNSVTVYYIRVM